MPRDWAQELLRSLPLPDAARAQLWESAYDDDWDTFTQKLTATVQPKSDRDARLLSAKLSRANEARMTLNQQAMMEAPAPQRQGMLDRAADFAFKSALPEIGGMMPFVGPMYTLGVKAGPAELASAAAENVRGAIMQEPTKADQLEAATAQEASVMARARQNLATPEELAQLDAQIRAARQQPTGRAALAAGVTAPLLTAGVSAESATSPFGALTAVMGAAPATAVRAAPAAALAAGRTAVKAGTALGVQQSLQNARQAFTSGTPEEQIMAAADIASTGLGFAGMAAQGRYGATPVQDVPKAVAQQVRAAGQARQQQRQATRNMKADIKLFGDIKVIAPAGGAALSISPDDSMRVRRVMSQGATALGLTPDTLPVDRDGYVLLADIVRQGADETYRPLGEVGDQLKAQFDAAEQNLQIAQRNVLAGAGSPAQVVQAERLVRQLANDAFVTIDRTQFNTMLRRKLKESPGAVREAMAYLDSIGDPLNPDAPPSFDSMTVRQALDRLRYVNALELQSGDLQTQNLSQKQRVNADTAALSTYKGLLLEQIGAKLKGAGVDASDRLQDGAVATKLAKRLERNDPDRLAEAQGEIKTLPQRLAEGASAAVPVVAGTAVGAGLGALTGEVVGGAAMGAGLSSALYGRTAGRQIGRDVAQSAAGRTRADVAQTMVRSILNEAPVPGAPVPSLVPVPPATLVTGAPPLPTTPQVPSRAVQIARAVQTPPPMQVAAEVSGGGATAAPVVRYRVINGLTGQVVKTFADVGGQGQATADAYARQQSRSPQYAQEFRDILEGFSGSDADLQQYIAQMLGRPLPPTSPPTTPTAPPSSPPSGPVAGGGPAAPMPPPVPQRAPERPKPIEFSFERGPAAPMPPPGGTSAAMSAAPETGPAPAAMGAAPEAVASKPSLPPETSGSSAAFTQPSTAATGAFTLPQDLAKSSPRYGAATLTFASDYDRAAYILANDERNRLRGQPPSKAADKFKMALEAQGYAVPDVVRHGRAVIQAVKDAAGGGAAPQEAMRLTIQPVATGATPPTAAPKTIPVVSSSAPLASAPQPSPSPDTAPLGAPETAAAPPGAELDMFGNPIAPPPISGAVDAQTMAPADLQAAEQAGLIINNFPVRDLGAKPTVLQYKRAPGEDGQTGSLKGVKVYDPLLGGVLTAWRDPADGQALVVNGHNRLERAKELGVQTHPVRFIQANTAKEARAIGAMMNIAEGRGTVFDAADFFRESGITNMDELQARGLPLAESKVSDGFYLSRLHRALYERVEQKQLTISAGAGIGRILPDKNDQLALLKLLDQKKGLATDVILELAEQASGIKRVNETQVDLFGSNEVSRSLMVEQAQIVAAINRRLTSDRRLFAKVGKESAAEKLAQAGNVIDAEANARQAEQAALVLDVFNRLKSSQFAPLLNQAAERKYQGESLDAIVNSIFPEIVTGVSQAFKGRN